jgi:hypothetical protein
MMAMLLEGAGRYEEAGLILVGLIDNGFETFTVYDLLARIARSMGNMDQSIEYMHKSLKMRDVA